MDFNLLIAVLLVFLAVILGAAKVIRLFIDRDLHRKRAVVVLAVGCTVFFLLARHAYQVHWLNEELWSAANGGDGARAQRLLRAGANPNTEWENGETALGVALQHRKELGTHPHGRHYDAVIALLRKAGAQEPR